MPFFSLTLQAWQHYVRQTQMSASSLRTTWPCFRACAQSPRRALTMWPLYSRNSAVLWTPESPSILPHQPHRCLHPVLPKNGAAGPVRSSLLFFYLHSRLIREIIWESKAGQVDIMIVRRDLAQNTKYVSVHFCVALCVLLQLLLHGRSPALVILRRRSQIPDDIPKISVGNEISN